MTAKFNELKKYTITTNYSESGIPSKTTTVNSGESYSATIEIPCSLYRESGTISGWTGVVWEGANYNALYKPSSEYTRVSITVKKGSSSGTDVTSSVVGKTTFNGVSYDSVTIYNVKDNYYINARGTT